MVLASGSERFRVPKTSSEETGLVKDTVPPSIKCKNKWALNIFAEWQSLREVKVPVLDCGDGVFKDYELGTSTSVVSTSCLLYTSPSPRDVSTSRMPSST